MLIVEAIKGNLTVAQASDAKINELENWKKRNPMVRYEKFVNKGKNEVTIDFVLSYGKAFMNGMSIGIKNKNINPETTWFFILIPIETIFLKK